MTENSNKFTQTVEFCQFLQGYYINPKVCDPLVEFFLANPNRYPGRFGGKKIDKKKKDSTDLSISHREEQHPSVQNYIYELSIACKLYIEKYHWSSDSQCAWSINEGLKIQEYLPNQGYRVWHTERQGPVGRNLFRHLVFMTYLNDVLDKGETEWYHQNLKVQPKKGLTVIWPADWTFVHRGIPSETETKYIATGWYSYD